MERPHIVSVKKLTGKYDLKIAFWARDPEELDAFPHEIKSDFSRIIKEWETFIFTKVYKWKELPF